MRAIFIALLLCTSCVDEPTTDEDIATFMETTQSPPSIQPQGSCQPEPVTTAPIDFSACNRRMQVFWYNCYIIWCDAPCTPGMFDCFKFHCEYRDIPIRESPE